jgi:hypothetical protein
MSATESNKQIVHMDSNVIDILNIFYIKEKQLCKLNLYENKIKLYFCLQITAALCSFYCGS